MIVDMLSLLSIECIFYIKSTHYDGIIIEIDCYSNNLHYAL